MNLDHRKSSPAPGSPSFALDSKFLKWRFLLARSHRRSLPPSAKGPPAARP